MAKAKRAIQMRRFILTLLALFLAVPAYAQGTLPVSLTQQFSFTGCTTAANVCGTPLVGGQLYFYQVGTVATRQNSFQDTALSIQNPWPLTLDANGRVPAFYLANGSVHVRLTDASGVVMFDYPSALVIGPSSGAGGGASVDPTSVLSTGDIKFRATGETVTGWVKLNAQTVGSATSGATGRANNDTQSLFIYLWGNCPDAHCPVVGGRGGSALADFNANKQITLMDWRARMPFGLDDMGNSAVGRLLASNVTSGGGDGVTTPNATGGETNHTLTATELANHTHTVTDPGHVHNAGDNVAIFNGVGGQGPSSGGSNLTAIGSAVTGITIPATPGGATPTGGAAHNNMSPFMLGTWYIKL
jgi:hypothetical protein